MSRTFVLSIDQNKVESLLMAEKIEGLRLHAVVSENVILSRHIVDNEGNQGRLQSGFIVFRGTSDASNILERLRAAGIRTTFVG